jgi:hypothetical protein
VKRPRLPKGKVGALIDALAIRAHRAAPDDEYGVFFIDRTDRVIGWARVEHCGGFEQAIPMALAGITSVDGAYRAHHDRVVRAYKVQHHATGEERIIFRETA